MKYELTSEDKKFINKATNIGKEIFYIYEQLANLEIDGKNIDNIEYKSNVSKLRKLVSIENSIYNNHSADIKRLGLGCMVECLYSFALLRIAATAA